VFEIEADGAADGIEAVALAGVAEGGFAGPIEFGGGHGAVSVFVFVEEPRIQAAVSATSGAPAAGGIEGEMFGIEFGVGFAGDGIGAGGGEPGEDFAVGGEEEAGAFSEGKGLLEEF